MREMQHELDRTKEELHIQQDRFELERAKKELQEQEMRMKLEEYMMRLENEREITKKLQQELGRKGSW